MAALVLNARQRNVIVDFKRSKPLQPSPARLVPLSPTSRSRLFLFAKLAIFALVVIGICLSINRASKELAEKQFNWRDIGWGWLAIAGMAYSLSMAPMAWFWQRLLVNMNQRVGFYEAFRAYTIGHLGKYVPGKVMVIVLRTGLIRSQHMDDVIVAVTVFVETLTMMATGAFLAAVTITIWFQNPMLQLMAVGLMLATVSVTMPPVLKLVIRKLKSKQPADKIEPILANLTWSSIAIGWLASCVTWALITISLWATLRGIPNVPDLPANLTSFAQLLASISLAVVAGFLALLFPGGVGPREWVLHQTLVPIIGPIATIAAIVLRLIWLLAELLLSLILYLIPPRGAASLAAKSSE